MAIKAPNLNGKKILITGAAGFVGSNLLRRLISNYPQAKIYITLRKSSDTWRIKDILKKVKILQVDLADQENLKRNLSKIKPDIIFHLAAYGAYAKQNSLESAVQININGTKNLLLALENTDYQIFVNTGSSSEYGYKSHPMKETDLLEPNSYYSATKAASTLICNTYGLMMKKPIITIRLFSIFGPYEEPGRLIPTVIMQALNSQKINIVGNSQKRDFVYIEDLIDAYLQCTKLKKFDQRTFNICSGKQTSIEKITRLIVKLAHSKSEIAIGSYPGRPWDTSFWLGNNQLTKNVLKWQPKNTLTEGLMEAINWFKINKDLYNKN
ncbi:MAG: NAD-dependent epimerase/dehydratase family protein [Microgenomates group bacterium]|jgi:nucleoside-diphosphate-sugar epimerase